RQWRFSLRAAPDADRSCQCRLILGDFVRTDRLKRFLWTMFLLSFALSANPLVAQNGVPNDYRGSYYYQAYDQGFRAGQADYLGGRPYGYHTALFTTAGLSGISPDYRNVFKLGYQDGYAGHRRGSDCITATIATTVTATRMIIVAGNTGAAVNTMTTANIKAGISTTAAMKMTMIDER